MCCRTLIPGLKRPRQEDPMPTTRCPSRMRRAAWLAVSVCIAMLLGGGGLSPQAKAGAVPLVYSELTVAASDPGVLLLLVPDGTFETDPGVKAWKDAASEIGVRMTMITDSQFLTMGTDTALEYAGLVLPDQLHTIATDEVVAAIRDFTYLGGQTFLTFDFGALSLRSDGAPVYPIPKSRLSDLAGVDYVLYDKYLDRTVGLGPVTAMRSTLRELQVPPGKSEPFITPPPSSSNARDGSPTIVSGAGPVAMSKIASMPEQAPARVVRPLGKVSGKAPLLLAAGVKEGEALYAPVSPTDPGGGRAFDTQQFQMLPMPDSAASGRIHSRAVQVNFGRARRAAEPAMASVVTPVAADLSNVTRAASGSLHVAEAGAADALQAYSGYLLGFLIYPSYVTEGSYTGIALAASPQFGLVAGLQSVGSGRVMFVNLPLTYLKGRTDALPMHGMLQYFVKHVLGSAQLANVPNGVPGVIFNWHLDSMEAQRPMRALEQAGIFNTGTTSMHMTAGPDTINIGDQLGFDLNNNSTAQAFMRRMDAKGHSVGSHGGWIHDYYGLNASETNGGDFLQYLVLNRQAVDGTLGHLSRDYSAPQGNNPRWAMDWLEQQGVVGVYFGGHTGLGVTRQYRDGDLRNSNLWVVPVTPMGNYATFEEFQEFSVPKVDVIDWYHSLVDFGIAQNTVRMVYAHPPGAYAWIDVMKDLQAYAKAQGVTKFQWYNMARLANFMTKRQQVQWSEQLVDGGVVQFRASHPADLGEMVWRLPKLRYLRPNTVNGGRVEDGGSVWLVRATAGVRTLTFRAVLDPV